jgi:hypothetical protein
MVIAETDTATGHFDDATLDALAEVSPYLPQPCPGRISCKRPDKVLVRAIWRVRRWSG